MCQRLV